MCPGTVLRHQMRRQVAVVVAAVSPLPQKVSVMMSAASRGRGEGTVQPPPSPMLINEGGGQARWTPSLPSTAGSERASPAQPVDVCCVGGGGSTDDQSRKGSSNSGDSTAVAARSRKLGGCAHCGGWSHQEDSLRLLESTIELNCFLTE